MRILLATLVLAPSLAFAAGRDSGATKPTQTTQDCFSERQWDPEIKRYVRFSSKVNGV